MVLPQRHRLAAVVFSITSINAGNAFNKACCNFGLPRRPSCCVNRRRLERELRLGVVISSKVSKRAVKRNRLRRRLHELCASALPLRSASHLALLNLRPGAAELGDDNLLKEWSTLIQRAGLTDS